MCVRRILAIAATIFLPVLRIVAQESDTNGPVLISFTLSPPSIDTRAGAQSIFFGVHATDDLSGVRQADIFLRKPSGSETFAAVLALTSGDARDGVWTGLKTFQPFDESGIWTISQLEIADTAGNYTIFHATDLAALGFPSTLSVTSDPDVMAPRVTSVSIFPNVVDASTSAATVNVEVSASDEQTGVRLGVPCRFLYVSFILVGPSGGQPRSIPCWEFARTGGDDHDGTWRGSFTMPHYSQAGTWSIDRFRIEDIAGNATLLSDADARALGMIPLQVISSPEDIAPPVVRFIETTPAVINTAAAPQQVTMRLHMTDDLSGVDSLGQAFAFQSGYVSAASPSGHQLADISGFRLISGTTVDGVWEGRGTFAQFAESGTWRIGIVMKDAVYNRLNLSPADLDAAGLLSRLIVIRPSLEPDGSVGPSGGTVSDTAFGPRASIIAPAGVLTQTITVALDVIDPSQLPLPIPAGYSGVGTFFMHVELSPTPSFPLPSPGLTVVLPLLQSMAPGTLIDLHRVNTALGSLEPALDTSGQPVRGVVDVGGLSATFEHVSRFSTLVALVPDAKHVAIDVDPHPQSNEPARIHLADSRPIQVAIFSSNTFDAPKQVSRGTLTFGRTGDERSLKRCNPGSIDVNHDGFTDLICDFLTPLTGLGMGDTRAILRGLTIAGQRIEGSEAVVVGR